MPFPSKDSKYFRVEHSSAGSFRVDSSPESESFRLDSSSKSVRVDSSFGSFRVGSFESIKAGLKAAPFLKALKKCCCFLNPLSCSLPTVPAHHTYLQLDPSLFNLFLFLCAVHVEMFGIQKMDTSLHRHQHRHYYDSTGIPCIFRDVRDRSKVQDYIIQDLKGETVGRMPGTVNGQQLVIQNCQVSLKLARSVSAVDTELWQFCVTSNFWNFIG